MHSRLRKHLTLALFVLAVVTLVTHRTEIGRIWQRQPPLARFGKSILEQELETLKTDTPAMASDYNTYNKFRLGVPEALGYNYSRVIVVPKRKHEDTTWLDEELPDMARAIYVVNDRHAALRPPKNKGNEAMVYLSYVIDFYDALPDVVIFVHAHRWAWHNNDLLDGDTALMIRHLSPERVVREGYMNLRCQWYPGCPAWLRPGASSPNDEKKEEALVAAAWAELYPSQPVPAVLAQPCCSQFAASRERIRAQPRAEYERLRAWLLRTELRDSMSGRVFEYLWQVVFAGAPALCPAMHACYCDGYGACFADDDAFRAWLEARYRARQDEWDLMAAELAAAARDEYVARGDLERARTIEVVPKEQMDALRHRINEAWFVLDEKRQAALELGRDPAVRARVAGRDGP